MEATIASDSSLESSITPYGGTLTSGSPEVEAVISSVLTEASPFSFFTIIASPWESTGAKDEVGAGATSDIGGGDDDAEGDDGGEIPPDRPSESPCNKRGILRGQPVVFVLMIANV